MGLTSVSIHTEAQSDSAYNYHPTHEWGCVLFNIRHGSGNTGLAQGHIDRSGTYYHCSSREIFGGLDQSRLQADLCVFGVLCASARNKPCEEDVSRKDANNHSAKHSRERVDRAALLYGPPLIALTAA